jgi:hypothetical protein
LNNPDFLRTMISRANKSSQESVGLFEPIEHEVIQLRFVSFGQS